MNDLRRQTTWRWQEQLIPWGGLLLLVAALWLPFGLHGTGLVEDWSFYRSLDQRSVVEVTATNFSNQANRPFFILAWWLGHLLTPDSFVGLNLVLVLLLWGKGVVLHGIVRRLVPSQPELAFFSAVLLVLFPADRGIFCLRVINYHVSVLFFLLSVRLLLAHWFRPRWYWIAATLAAQLICLGTVEVACPLMLAFPLVLAVMEGGVTRKVVRVTAWWGVLPLLGIAAAFYVVRCGGSYGATLIKQGEETRESLLAALPQQLGRVLERHFVGGWRDVFADSLTVPAWGVAVVGGIVVLVGLVSWGMLRSGRSQPRWQAPSLQVCLGCFMAGLLSIVLGYAVFIPVPTHREFNDRVFLHSAVGGALCFASLLWLLCRRLPWPRLAYALPAAALSGLAAWGALGQHQEMQKYSLTEQQLLAGIARNAGNDTKDRLVLVVGDTSPLFANLLTFALAGSQHHFQDGVQFLYRDSDPLALVIHPVWKGGLPGAQHQIFKQDGVQTEKGPRGDGFYPYDKLIVLSRDRHGELTRLDALPPEFAEVGANVAAPLARRAESPGLPPRVHTLFRQWPFEMPRPEVKVRRNFHLDFDRPVEGAGWSMPEGSVTWTSAPVSTLQVPLARDSQYDLVFRLSAVLTAENFESMSVWVNGERLKLRTRRQETGGVECQALIPMAVVRRSEPPALLEFKVNGITSPKAINMNNDERNLGLQFDWLTISPRGKSQGEPQSGNR